MRYLADTTGSYESVPDRRLVRVKEFDFAFVFFARRTGRHTDSYCYGNTA